MAWRITLAVGSLAACVHGAAFAQADRKPAEAETPALSNRLFSSDTSAYDVKLPLGRFAIVDPARNLVTEFVEKGRFACDPAKALADASVVAMKPTVATSIMADESYKGELSFVIGSASIAKEERHELTVSDISVADVTNPCELSRAKIAEIARSLPGLPAGAAGRKLIWISGATLSNLNRRVFKSTGGKAEGGGSWLDIGGEGYKGSERVDSVPIIALRGYMVDLPSLSGTMSGGEDAGARKPPRFSTLRDLGLSPGLRVEAASTVLEAP